MSGPAPGAPALPELRRDLRLLPTTPAPSGEARYLIHDPVAGRFHRLGARAMALLRGARGTDAEREALGLFLLRNKLARTPLGAQRLAEEERRARPRLGQILVHKYLFFRIPLFRPQRFLDAMAPGVGWAFRRSFWAATALAGLAGLVLAGRQWDTFASTFMGFLSLEGALLYGLTLLGLKVLHELGHGFAAQRFGVRVPVMGVAFMVLMPIAYTETTEAWALRARGKRVLIDAAGMLTELMIAAWAILLWSFLPDGAAREAVFFVATTSWTLSLLVNLNPCMRFDGYYLIGDLLGVANLQATGFGLAKWRMRELLWGWGDPKPPLGDARGLEGAVLAYAYATWVYRFFLFIGIAVLVHHLFPKAIGIVLFIVEILMFIGLPIARELKVWAGRWRDSLASVRGRRSLLVAGLALALAFAPVSRRVAAPAVLEPARVSEVFAPVPAELVEVAVVHGDRVEAGAVLLRLRARDTERELAEARLERARARAELARAEAVRAFAVDLGPLRDAHRRTEERVRGLERLDAELVVRADAAGVVETAEVRLHPGRSVGQDAPLLRVRSEAMRISARIAETDAARLRPGAAARFVGADGRASEARVLRIAPVTEARLAKPALASVYGGPIAVEAQESELVPRRPVLALELATDHATARERVGRVFIDAEPRSPASRVWRRVVAVLVREGDF